LKLPPPGLQSGGRDLERARPRSRADPRWQRRLRRRRRREARVLEGRFRALPRARWGAEAPPSRL